jgi:transcriptional regulator
MTHAMKEMALSDKYEYSQKNIAEKMFLAVNTVASIEKRAIENFKKALADKGISVRDLLND